MSEGSQVLGVFYACTNYLRKAAEKIGSGRRELIASDEPPVVTKQFLNAIVVEDGESDRRFANATGTDESDGIELFDKTNDRLDQLVATETSLQRWRRRLSERTRFKRKLSDCP